MLQRPRKPARTREYKVRLAEDTALRIERKAKDLVRPQNRIIANELAEYPDLKRVGTLAENLGHLENMLMKYAGRITYLELTEELLRYVDEVLNTKGAAHDVAMDKLRAARNAMLKIKG
jgi:hypothetical protein